MRAWCRALGLLAAFATAAGARAEEVRLHLVTHGTINADLTVVHPIDDAHFCSAAADPWLIPDLPDTRATPFPFYRLIYGQSGPAAELDQPGPSMGLALSNYFAAARDHADPVNDSIELEVQGRHFIGHAGLGDPGYRLSVTYRDDRAGGSFVARHLHETGPGKGTLDVEGDWACPPVEADLPAQEVSVHALFPGAEPVRPEPPLLRLSHAGVPCRDRRCRQWRVTDDETGLGFLAGVDFSRLKLAGRLRREAERGEVDLLVAGKVRHGRTPLVVVQTLAGVEPAPPRTGARADAVPEAALY